MWLEDYLDKNKLGKSVQKLAKQSSTFSAYYNYWRDTLFERVMRLFVWENTGDVQPKEIEQRLMLSGHCGIMQFQGKLTAFYGSFYGPTVYYDEFTDYNVHSPIHSQSGLRIGKDIIVISNNSLRNPVMPLIHHYAIELAHADVTLVDLMVNARDAGGVPVASNEKQLQSIREYQGKIFNGQYDAVLDPAYLGVQYAGSSKSTNQNIVDVLQVKEKILKQFYSDIGVRSAFEKRSNAVESEVEADTSLLLLNLSDMIAYRQKGADEVNELFGTNWTVKIADEVQYGLENNPDERSMEGNDDEEV